MIPRLNRPFVRVYGGTIASGCFLKIRSLDIVSAFEACGEKVAGTMERRRFSKE